MSREPPTSENILWDLIESEADEKYYLDRYEENAELAAIMVLGPYSPFSESGSWVVYFGDGIAKWKFRTHKEADAKVMEIIRSTKSEVWVRKVEKNGRTRYLNDCYPFEPMKASRP